MPARCSYFVATEKTSSIPSEVGFEGLTNLHSLLKEMFVRIMGPMDMLSDVSVVCDPLVANGTMVLQLLHQGCNRKPAFPIWERPDKSLSHDQW